MSAQKVTYGFIPTAISNCALWLDGADSSTMFQNTAATTPVTTDGQTIGAWRDKSTNSYLFTQPVTGNQPTYKVGIQNGYSLTRWNGTSSGLQSSTTLPFYTSASSGGSFFFVFMITNNSSQHFLMTYQNQISGTFSVSESEIGCPTGNADTGNFGIHQGSSKANVALNQITTNTYVMMNLNLLGSGTAPANTTIYKNGTSATMTAQNGGFYSGTTYPYTNNSRYLNIGYRVPFGVNPIDCWLPGDIAEIIWYQTPVSTSQQQQVEAYLAQKWGLTAFLPPGHPGLTTTIYRADYTKTNIAKAIPYYTKFSPKSVPNCLIWFDAADSTTLGLTGTTVNTWTSKGSYTGNAAASTGTVVSGTVTQNGVNVVRFAAGTQLAFTMAVPNQARAWFSVTRCTTQLSQATNPSFWGIIDSPSSGAGEEAITGQVYGVPATNSYTVSLLQPGIADIVKTTTAADSYQIWTIISHVNSAVSTANNIITINGTSQTLAISSLASGYRTSSYTKIINKASLNSGMDVGEIIMYNGEITSTQRQQVESYLAQKWGLTASLPGGHLHLTQQAGAVTTVALSKYRMVGLPRISFASTGLVITHQDGRTWKATANNPGYANYAIGLNSGASMSLDIYAGSDVYNSAGGRVALFYNGDSNNAVRHAGYVMWTSTFAANNFDFGWKFVSSGSGYLIYNDYPSYSSWQVSYDPAQDRVLIVSPSDGKYGMVWNITPRVTLAYVYSSY